jgi:acyl-CoA reductase-like NAD-dependent aldehyde dehydrogenase
VITDAQLLINGKWTDGESTTEITNKFDGSRVGDLHIPSRAQVTEAVGSVVAAQQEHPLNPYDRFRILSRTAELLDADRDAFAQLYVLDSGLTIVDARREIERAVQTMLLCGEEAKRLTGEMVPFSSTPAGGNRLGFTVRHPIGTVVAITPFNSPVNTPAHKIGPALAAGNGVVFKPAERTPLTANRLVELLLEAGLPERLISVVHGPGATTGQWLLEDERPGFYAFTGSTAIGTHIQSTVGVRPTQMELGGLSSTIICDDAALDRAAGLCVNAGFRKSGQVCTSVQRLYVQRTVQDEFAERLLALLRRRRTGDPRDEGTFIGPLISPQAADRVESWVNAATGQGARLLAGGTRARQVIEPTLLADVTADMDVMRKEVFGPVVSLRPFDQLSDCIDEANDTPYGLAAGIFTASLDRALQAADRLHVGTVHINETSSARIDLMPYGGVKRSGFGKEGPHYAVREMTEERLITLGGTD